MNTELHRAAISASPVLPEMRKLARRLGLTFRRKRHPSWGGLVWQMGTKLRPSLYGEVWLHEDGGRLDQIRLTGLKPTHSLGVGMKHLELMARTAVVTIATSQELALLGPISTQEVEIIPEEIGLEAALYETNTGNLDLLIETGSIQVVPMEAIVPELKLTKVDIEAIEREAHIHIPSRRATLLTAWAMFSLGLFGLLAGVGGILITWVIGAPFLLIPIGIGMAVAWELTKWSIHRYDELIEEPQTEVIELRRSEMRRAA